MTQQLYRLLEGPCAHGWDRNPPLSVFLVHSRPEYASHVSLQDDSDVFRSGLPFHLRSRHNRLPKGIVCSKVAFGHLARCRATSTTAGLFGGCHITILWSPRNFVNISILWVDKKDVIAIIGMEVER